ncbi:hypothetical protein [Nonomuraea sp. NPDC049141]|uniref:hypothetical protein n=1 Tax=Nonomuraea sp. NPDC049141 TaxID=3155500 RepID=UPI0033F6326C
MSGVGTWTRTARFLEGERFQVYGIGHGLSAFVVEVHAVVSVVPIQSFTSRREARPSGVLIPG